MNAKARLGWVKLYERTGNATLKSAGAVASQRRPCANGSGAMPPRVRLVSKTAAGAQKRHRNGESLPNKSVLFLRCVAHVSSASSGCVMSCYGSMA